MANLVYLQIISGNTKETSAKGKIPASASLTGLSSNEVFVFPLIEDLKLTVETKMTSFSEMLGGLSEMVNKVSSITSAMSGKAGVGLVNLSNMFDVPRWEKTMPVSFNIKIPFYTISSAYDDVVLPMSKIINLTVLTISQDGKSFTVPGISASSLRVTSKPDPKKSSAPIAAGAKLISIKIPGIIYLPLAMVTKAEPTYSRQLTESGFPLWGELDCAITGLYPATDDLFGQDLYSQDNTFGKVGGI